MAVWHAGAQRRRPVEWGQGVRRRSARVWSLMTTCEGGHPAVVRFTLPDYGDADELFQCRPCGELVIVNPDAEYYVGPRWDDLRSTVSCPTCNESLEYALAYPSNFRCGQCGRINLLRDPIPTAYPPDSESEILEGWDPYS